MGFSASVDNTLRDLQILHILRKPNSIIALLFNQRSFAISLFVFPLAKYIGPGKRGHIVADTLLLAQMFPRLPARATFVADTKNISDFVQKHFVSATNVSQFAQPKQHHGQQCVLVYQCLNTTLSPGFLGQLFNNLRRAALLTSSVQ